MQTSMRRMITVVGGIGYNSPYFYGTISIGHFAVNGQACELLLHSQGVWKYSGQAIFHCFVERSKCCVLDNTFKRCYIFAFRGIAKHFLQLLKKDFSSTKCCTSCRMADINGHKTSAVRTMCS
ncbi:hypothetical protein GDO81_009910 [Engystomops pustulosus]|uniref:Uncharacterized protein n=1 Tax=Engystomops pustulosus TaxID=76066 RepID=A0AAV7BVC3_ENGPU|nr:hypothetical protein GDO81_009910 [Engystomops pustulosus]